VEDECISRSTSHDACVRVACSEGEKSFSPWSEPIVINAKRSLPAAPPVPSPEPSDDEGGSPNVLRTASSEGWNPWAKPIVIAAKRSLSRPPRAGGPGAVDPSGGGGQGDMMGAAVPPSVAGARPAVTVTTFTTDAGPAGAETGVADTQAKTAKTGVADAQAETGVADIQAARLAQMQLMQNKVLREVEQLREVVNQCRRELAKHETTVEEKDLLVASLARQLEALQLEALDAKVQSPNSTVYIDTTGVPESKQTAGASVVAHPELAKELSQEFTLKAAYTHKIEKLAGDTPVSPTLHERGGGGGERGGAGGGGALEREDTSDSVSSSYRCSVSEPAPAAMAGDPPPAALARVQEVGDPGSAGAALAATTCGTPQATIDGEMPEVDLEQTPACCALESQELWVQTLLKEKPLGVSGRGLWGLVKDYSGFSRAGSLTKDDWKATVQKLRAAASSSSEWEDSEEESRGGSSVHDEWSLKLEALKQAAAGASRLHGSDGKEDTAVAAAPQRARARLGTAAPAPPAPSGGAVGARAERVAPTDELLAADVAVELLLRGDDSLSLAHVADQGGVAGNAQEAAAEGDQPPSSKDVFKLAFF